MNYLSPLFNEQTFDDNGDPLVSGQIETYAAGTSTALATYTTQNGAVQHANPIILDARGEPADPIWLAASQEYKFVLKTAAGVTIRTIDDVSGVNDVTTAGSEWITSGFTPTYISTTSFSVTGDRTGTLSPGRRLQTTNTGGTIYSTISTSTFGAGITTVVVRNDSGVLDSGISAINYGILAPDNPSVPNAQAVRQTLGLGYGADIASAATLVLTGRTGTIIRISGTITVTAFTMANGDKVLLTAEGALPINVAGVLVYTCTAEDSVLLWQDIDGVQHAQVFKTGQSPVFTESPFNLTAAVSSNALTVTLAAGGWFFRNPTAGTGGMEYVKTDTALTLTISSGSTLGTTNAVQNDVLVRVANDAGTLRLTAENLIGGMSANEFGTISTTAEGGAGGADSSTVIYSGTAVTSKAYRIAGVVRSTQATAGTWATQPSRVVSANSASKLDSILLGQTYQNVTGSRVNGGTYYNDTDADIEVIISGTSTGGSGQISVGGVTIMDALGRSTYYNTMPIRFTVPVGMSYTTSNLDSITRWVELR